MDKLTVSRIVGIVIILALIYPSILFIRGPQPLEKRNISYSPSESIKENLSLEDYICEDCNVIIIVSDALRADHLSCYGYERNTTPNICALADEGILFENAIATSSWTRASVASILTGLYPKNHGANDRNDSLGEDLVLIPEILKEEDYNTFAFVTNGNIGDSFGFNQGYDLFEHMKENPKNIEIHVLSDVANEHIFAGLNYTSSEPYFMYVHYTDTHDPYVPQENVFSEPNSKIYSSKDMTQLQKTIKLLPNRKDVLEDLKNNYDDEVTFVDKNVGVLVDWLKTNNMEAKTVIIFTSDHGEEFFDHGKLRHGQTLYDESIRVPLIVKIPGGESRNISNQVSSVDIVPSVLDILNVSSPYLFDGVSFFSEVERPKVFSELILDNRRYISSRNDSLKVILNLKTGDFQDYDLLNDPSEKKNLASTKKFLDEEKELLSYWANVVHGEAVNFSELDPEVYESLKILGYADTDNSFIEGGEDSKGGLVG